MSINKTIAFVVFRNINWAQSVCQGWLFWTMNSACEIQMTGTMFWILHAKMSQNFFFKKAMVIIGKNK